MIAAILVLAAGTYAFRLSGVLLRDRLELSASLQRRFPSRRPHCWRPWRQRPH
jgi:hypothetical protein